MNERKPNRVSWRCVAALAVLLSTAGPQPARADTPDDAVVQRALDALRAGLCDRFWELIWPHAESGQPRAVALVAGAMYSYRLTPPGAGADVLFRLRGTMAGFAEGARDGDPRAAAVLAELLRFDVFDEVDGKGHAACLDTAADQANCVDAAQRAGLFPDFRQWVSEIDAIELVGGAASCDRSLPVRPWQLGDEMPGAAEG